LIFRDSFNGDEARIVSRSSVVEAGKTHGKYAVVLKEHKEIDDLTLTLSSMERESILILVTDTLARYFARHLFMLK
jgi:hypothetical protein